jgi:prepilin-type N-terminal cleavage/methylation domain-containing protein
MTANRERGMTLMECAAALALIGMAVLTAGAFFNLQPHLTERLLAQQEAARALEYALETVRAGALPVAVGASPVSLPNPTEKARGLTVTLHVTPGEKAGLYVVTAEANFWAGGKPYRRQLTTMVWRPS